MLDREKTALGIREMIMRDTWRDIDADRSRYQRVLNDCIALLKEQESWINEIAEYQQSISGSGMHELDDYEKGKWDGLQIAWNIISEGR